MFRALVTCPDNECAEAFDAVAELEQLEALICDCGCTLRLVRREGLLRFRDKLTVRGSHFLPEMVILAHQHGLKIIEIPVNYRGRLGTSKITGTLKGTLRTGTNMIRLILGYRLRYANGKPLE